MMTDTQYLAWLRSSGATRCILIEAAVRVAGVETTRYLSSSNYITGASDAPAHRAYESAIQGGVTITEKLSIDGSASLAWGDIELGNESGSRDSWLNDVWENRAITIWSGDARWPRADFRLIFSGVMAGISSRERGTLNIALRDKAQRLNTPLSENKLGGSTDNRDRLRPLCFGECHNVEPLLVSPALLQYQVHDGAIESVIEVRDNGVPVAFTANLAAGTFVLTSQPAGLITVSVQGDKFGGVYRNTVGSLIERIVTGYGKVGERFTAADLDTANFTAFEAAHPQTVGLYLPERTNTIQACADLAASVGAQPVPGNTGRLCLLKIALPAPGTATPAGPGEMIQRTLHATDRPAVVAAVKLGYCRNWTVQNALQSGIPEAHKALFAQEWLTKTASDSATAATYKLSAEPVQADTLLLAGLDASAEAARRLALWRVQRTVYAFTATPALMLQALGSPITLTSNRFGLSAGVPGQVVSISRDWTTCRTALEVLA